ncbi:MAG: hypothetical protein HC920_20780 [Oscillatoriales cyanobacterium SM2_3_0]|nr:hypothetical protein [Oscillatoriales cyanobacterium SM2_3_0]
MSSLRVCLVGLGLLGSVTMVRIDKLLFQSAVAHEIEVSGDVAATFHLEPNHNPKAGETAQVWFALTRRGGQIIPLGECNCKLAIYTEPRSPQAKPILTPTLKAISAEKYQGIPGTNVIFPRVGNYSLVLSGTPQAGADFEPFQFVYGVTVR